MKHFRRSLAFSFILILLTCNTAWAKTIMPIADTEFDVTTVFLKSSKEVTFRATTYDEKTALAITTCTLERKNDDGTWSTVRSLPAPGTVARNDFSFLVTVDYSSYIGSGTYRIKAIFSADGHTVTVRSNERTF